MKSRKGDEQLLLEAWSILVETARAKETITYKALGEKLQRRIIPRSIGKRVLTPIFERFTEPKGLPDISAVTVRSDRPVPGDNWWRGHGPPGDIKVWETELKRCWKFNWPDSPYSKGQTRREPEEKPAKAIVRTPGTVSGRPRINGTRIGVSDVWVAYLQALDELAVPLILKAFPHLNKRQVLEALYYSREHSEEIGKELKEERKAYEMGDPISPTGHFGDSRS